MASDQKFADYVLDQLQGAGSITSRRMFGEYAFYCDQRVVALLCDNQLYVKPTAGGRTFVREVTEGSPYPGAKPHLLVTDRIDDREWLVELVGITARELPAPKPRKSRRPPEAGQAKNGAKLSKGTRSGKRTTAKKAKPRRSRTTRKLKRR